MCYQLRFVYKRMHLPNVKIWVVHPRWYAGESEAARSFKKAADIMKIECEVLDDFPQIKSEDVCIALSIPCQRWSFQYTKPVPPYTYQMIDFTTDPSEEYVSRVKSQYKRLLHVAKHDPSFDAKYQPQHQSIITYYSSPLVPRDPVPPAKLFYCAETSFSRQHDLLKRLDDSDFFVVYGPRNKTWDDFKCYKGWTPDVLESTRKAGIALVLHSSNHINKGIPSARIFEALSARVLIISDEHPFVKENFGDCLLYQINRHPRSQLWSYRKICRMGAS